MFTDYGPEYSAFEAAGLKSGGGFYAANLASKSAQGAALAVFFSQNLSVTQTRVEAAGGKVRGPRKAENTVSGDEETEFLAAPAYSGVR